MSDDNEVREAAEIVLRDDAEFDGGTTRLAAIRVAKWAVSDLSRRAAEAAERAKPIDRAFIQSLGSETVPDDLYPDSRGNDNESIPINRSSLILWNFNDKCWLIRGFDSFDFNTRGQLLDLIEALKGGTK